MAALFLFRKLQNGAHSGVGTYLYHAGVEKGVEPGGLKTDYSGEWFGLVGERDHESRGGFVLPIADGVRQAGVGCERKMEVVKRDYLFKSKSYQLLLLAVVFLCMFSVWFIAYKSPLVF